VEKGEMVQLYVVNRGRRFFTGKLNMCNRIMHEYDEAVSCMASPAVFQYHVSCGLLDETRNRCLRTFIYCDYNGFHINYISTQKLAFDREYYRKMNNLLEVDSKAYFKEVLSWLGVEFDSNMECLVNEATTTTCQLRMAEVLEQYVTEPGLDLDHFIELKTKIAGIIHEYYPRSDVRGDRPLSTEKFMECLLGFGMPYTLETQKDKASRRSIYKIIRLENI
jgi:hypothetical protein